MDKAKCNTKKANAPLASDDRSGLAGGWKFMQGCTERWVWKGSVDWRGKTSDAKAQGMVTRKASEARYSQAETT